MLIERVRDLIFLASSQALGLGGIGVLSSVNVLDVQAQNLSSHLVLKTADGLSMSGSLPFLLHTAVVTCIRVSGSQ
jgi:hypothetical protein